MKAQFESQRTSIYITEENKLAIDVLGIVCEYDLGDAMDLNMTITGMVDKMKENKRKELPWTKRLFR